MKYVVNPWSMSCMAVNLGEFDSTKRKFNVLRLLLDENFRELVYWNTTYLPTF